MKATLLSLILFISLLVNGQESAKQKELGLAFRDLNAFGLTYRCGTANSLWRYNTALMSGGTQKETRDSADYIANSFISALSAGKEFRKSLNDVLELRIGADVSFTFDRVRNKTDDFSIHNHDHSSWQNSYKPGINLVLGFNYALGEHVLIGAELLPGINYAITVNKWREYSNYDLLRKRTIKEFNGSIANSQALLTLVYKL